MIYICKHTEFDNPVPKDHQEIYVGEMFDGGEDNINELNPYINELTALYQIWKEVTDDIIGFVHYRRLFYDEDNHEFVTLATAEKILEDYDIITTEPYLFKMDIYNQLRFEFLCEDKEILDKYKEKLCDQVPGLKHYFDETHLMYPRNMFICKRETITKFFEWLFPIIIPLTKEFIAKDLYKVTRTRMVGFLFERLLGFWILQNNLKVYEMKYMKL